MIIKSFRTNEIKNYNCKLYLLYGENEGHKDEVIKDTFLKDFKGELITYDENQVLDNYNDFYETCFNESLFENEKIVLIKRATNKLYDTVIQLMNKEVHDKKIILISGALEKKSKIRQLFEKENKLICIPFYKDNSATLHKITSDIFRSKKISISSENISLIIEKCSGDRKNLQNEMNKILNFCFGKNKISREEILKLINLYDDENYFELIDHCLSKNHKSVCKIINDKNFTNNDSIILIRSLLSRLKRLIQLKKLNSQMSNTKDVVDSFRPPIFWKEKEIVHKQIDKWSIEKVYELLDKANTLEINFKKNSNLSNNLIFDLLINTSNN